MADAPLEQAPHQHQADTIAGAVPGALPDVTGRTASGGNRLTQAELWESHSDATRIEMVPTFPTPAYMVVREPAALEQLLPELQTAPVLGIDTETTGLDPLSDRLRLLQLATADRVIVMDLATIPVQMLAALFAQDREWLAHNGLFDVRFLMAAGLPWSGRLFDTMLASQLLDRKSTRLNSSHLGISY